MKKKQKYMFRTFHFSICLLLFTLFTLMWTASAFSYFLDAAAGVRPAGMGDAFVSVADDPNTVLFNPAGFVRIPDYAFTGMYADLYAGLNARLYTGQPDQLGYNFLSFAIPASPAVGSFGASWTHLYTVFYKENAFTLSYARGLLPKGLLDVGISLKALHWLVEANDFSMDPAYYPYADRSRLGFTADAGLLFTPFEGFTLGAAVENAVPSDLGFSRAHYVPQVYRLGVSFLKQWQNSALDSLRASLEGDSRAGLPDVKFGLEGWLFGQILGLRAGINLDQASAGASFCYPWPDSGLRLQVDYAFAYPLQITAAYSHRAGLTAGWNPAYMPKPRPAPQPTPAPPPRLEVLQEQKKAATAEIKAFKQTIEVKRLSPIQFEFRKSRLLASSYPTLDYLGRILEKYPFLQFRIEGHTSSEGTEAYNLKLSSHRVEAVKEYLSSHFQINPGNLLLKGWGKSRPIASNADESGRSKNRRVEFHVVDPGREEYQLQEIP